jgi:hypothetical protein
VPTVAFLFFTSSSEKRKQKLVVRSTNRPFHASQWGNELSNMHSKARLQKLNAKTVTFFH